MMDDNTNKDTEETFESLPFQVRNRIRNIKKAQRFDLSWCKFTIL